MRRAIIGVLAATLLSACGPSEPSSTDAMPVTDTTVSAGAATATEDVIGTAAAETDQIAEQTVWYAADMDLEECIQSKSPAQRIQEVRDSGASPKTSESYGPSGQLVVEVSASEAYGLQERYWTYYQGQADCEAAVAADNAIPERYR